jgi:uncharacterized protein (TIGR00375 family)
MRFIADLHVHSRHSMATSRDMCPEGLWQWAQLKGIGVVGTGDFTHPEYFRELTEKLEPAGGGLFSLRESYQGGDVPPSCRAEVRFMLQAEVSSIYSKAGRTRKVHSIIFMPGLAEARELNRRLSEVGNIRSDGRPILGLDAKKLLHMVLDVSPRAMVVPAHAWTPHFSVFGAASGFDSLEECYEELAPHIHAIETGLSSDPPMNRRLSALDRLTLLSNSDAHSPAKLGREGNVFETEPSYDAMMEAVKTGEGFWGTIEFFPEEGKYHLDGHRACGVSMTPEETRANGYRCPACGRKPTVGVMHRVEELADRTVPAKTDHVSIIPLVEIIAEVMQRGANTKGVQRTYHAILSALGSEFTLLLDTPLDAIEGAGDGKLAGAIGKMRAGEVDIVPGYDGEFGKIRIFGAPQGRKAEARRKGPVRGKGGKKAGRGRQEGLF